MSTSLPAIIIGGGISGLSAAYWLKQYGIPVTVLERSPHPGGTMRTQKIEGWMVETGPNSALETTPLFEPMFRTLGIAGDRLYANPSSDKRFILRGGKLYVLPMSLGAFFKTRLWTLRGKIRLLKEPFIGRAQQEETIAQFVERRLGREFLDYAINPFVAGVFAGNPEQLSVHAAFPKLYALEEKYGGLMRGMIGGAHERKRRAEKAKDRAKMFSFRGGMQVFPEALSRYLGHQFRPGAYVHNIVPQPDKNGAGPKFVVTAVLDGSTVQLDADAVIVSATSYGSAPLIRGFVPELAGHLENIYYPPVAEVFLGYDLRNIPFPLDGFGYLIPAVERRKILGTIWSSSLFPDRAPAGHAALTSFVGGSRQPDLLDYDDPDLVAIAHAEVSSILGVNGPPAFSRVIRWEKAIPQYNLGYSRITDLIDGAEVRYPGLYFCANYRRGIAVGDCIMNGERIAARVAAGLGKVPDRPAGVTD